MLSVTQIFLVLPMSAQNSFIISRTVTFAPFSARYSAVSMPTIPPPITTTLTLPDMSVFPLRTSWELTTKSLSFPGIIGIMGVAPIALMSVCGIICETSSGVTAVFIRISTPRRFAFSPMAKTAFFISSFLGASPAVRNCPPSWSDASHKIGLCPLCFKIIAASSPPIPPPATSTVSGFAAGTILHSSSRPNAGFLRHVMHGESVFSNPS